MTSKADGGIQTNAPVSNSSVSCWLENTVAYSVHGVTFARTLAGLFAVAAGIERGSAA